MEKISRHLINTLLGSNSISQQVQILIGSNYHRDLAHIFSINPTRISTPFEALNNIKFRIQLEKFMTKYGARVSYGDGGNISCENSKMLLHIPTSSNIEELLYNFTYYSTKLNPAKLYSFKDDVNNVAKSILYNKIYLWQPSILTLGQHLELNNYYQNIKDLGNMMFASIDLQSQEILKNPDFCISNFVVPQYSSGKVIELQKFAERQLDNTPVLLILKEPILTADEVDNIAHIVEFTKTFYQDIML